MLNVHLMTLTPEKIIDRLFNLSIHAIAFHPMTTQNPSELIERFNPMEYSQELQ